MTKEEPPIATSKAVAAPETDVAQLLANNTGQRQIEILMRMLEPNTMVSGAAPHSASAKQRTCDIRLVFCYHYG